MQKIVDSKFQQLRKQDKSPPPPDCIGNKSYSLEQQFRPMKQMMDRLGNKDYLRKKDRKQMDLVGDCDQVIS